MKIAGLQKLTLLDYPEHIACTIFLAGCNIRCTFCQNVDLVYNTNNVQEMSIDYIMEFLSERKGKLQGVAITGGEPLLNKDIRDLLIPIKQMGFNIKLDTNGYFPDLLNEIIEEKLVDMVAMDIKSSKEKYEMITQVKSDVYKKSIEILMSDKLKNNNIKYEFRTTCVKGIHTDSDFYDIREMIKNADNYYLQNYFANDLIKDLPYQSFERAELEHFSDIMKGYVKNIGIRGI